METFSPETILAYLTIAGTLMYWLSVVFIRPQKENIREIRHDVSDIKNDMRLFNKKLDESMYDRRNLEARIARIEASDKSAHKRIDVIEKRLDSREREAD